MPSSSHPKSSSSHTTSGNKRKRTEEDTRSKKRMQNKENQTREDKHQRKEDSFDVYKDFARWIVRTEHLFISWYAVLDVGLKLDAEDYEDKEEFMKKFRIEVAIYRRLHKEHPQFAREMKKMQRKQKYEKDFVSALNHASRGARSDDSNGLLTKSLEYIDEKHGTLIPPISASRPKADVRGFNHPMIARLLCPIDYIVLFDQDPEGFRAKLLNGSIKIHSTHYPLCLYDEELIDDDDPALGFLRSKVLIAFFRHIFTSPSSALQDKPGRTKGKKGQAEKHDMKRVTPGSIAYAATQLRWCLSGSDDWRLGDGNWTPEEFYSAIMLAFGIRVSGHEDEVENDSEVEEEDEWVTETLSWWNGKIFGTKPAATASPPVHGSTLEKLLAKRAAKKRARKASAATATPPSAATSTSTSTSLAAASTSTATTADDEDSTTLAGSSSPGPETSIKAHRKVSKRKQVVIESESDEDEQEVKKTKGKKKKHYLRESDSDDDETNNQGPGNVGADNDTETDDEDE